MSFQIKSGLYQPNTALVKKMPANVHGRDFAVSDVHGYYSLLEKLLEHVGFNQEIDRLFIIGDMVDRGPESADVIKWLKKPHVYPLLGNHDEWCIKAGADRMVQDHYFNGGTWFYDLDGDDRADIVDRFSTLPIAMEVETKDGKRVGMVHADCVAETWSELCDILTTGGGLIDYQVNDTIFDSMWSRNRMYDQVMDGVPDIDRVLVGHTSVQEVIALGNVYYIDTGACYAKEGGKLSLVNINTLEVFDIITTTEEFGYKQIASSQDGIAQRRKPVL